MGALPILLLLVQGRTHVWLEHMNGLCSELVQEDCAKLIREIDPKRRRVAIRDNTQVPYFPPHGEISLLFQGNPLGSRADNKSLKEKKVRIGKTKRTRARARARARARERESERARERESERERERERERATL